MDSNLEASKEEKYRLSPVSRMYLDNQRMFIHPNEDIQVFNHLSDVSRIHYKQSLNEQSCATINEMTEMLERKKVPVDN